MRCLLISTLHQGSTRNEALQAIQKLEALLEEYQGVAEFDLLELEVGAEEGVKKEVQEVKKVLSGFRRQVGAAGTSQGKGGIVDAGATAGPLAAR